MLFKAQDNKSLGVWLLGYTQVKKYMSAPESIKFRVTESFLQNVLTVDKNLLEYF